MPMTDESISDVSLYLIIDDNNMTTFDCLRSKLRPLEGPSAIDRTSHDRGL